MTYSWSHWHPGYRSQCPDGRTCCERGRCFCGGRVGTRRSESPRGSETSSHLTRTHGETEKRMHHLLTMRLKRVPQPPLILCSAPARPAHAHTRTHTHKDKVIRLSVYCSGARKTTNIRGAGGYSPAQPCSPWGDWSQSKRSCVHPPALPCPTPTPEPPAHPHPAWLLEIQQGEVG